MTLLPVALLNQEQVKNKTSIIRNFKIHYKRPFLCKSEVAVSSSIALIITISLILVTITSNSNLLFISYKETYGQEEASNVINVSHNNGSSVLFASGATIGSQAQYFARAQNNGNIAASGNNVYVVWMDNTTSTGSYNIFFAQSNDNGTTFSEPIKLSNSTLAISPQVAVSGNNVYVVWMDYYLESNFEIFFTKSVDGGKTFADPIDISSTPQTESVDPQITASGDSAYVVWSEHVLEGASVFSPNALGPGDIFFSRISNIGSSQPVNLSNNPGDSYSPRVSVTGATAYVVWTDDTPGNSDVYFERIRDKGSTLDGWLDVSENPGEDRYPHMAISGSNVYILWRNLLKNESGSPATQLQLILSQDGGYSFGNVSALPPDTPLPDYPKIAVSKDDVYVIWEDASVGNLNVYLTKGNYTGITSITNDSTEAFPFYWNMSQENTGNSSNAQVAVSGNNVYVVWNDNTPGDYEIYLVSSNNSGEAYSDILNLSNNDDSSLYPKIITSQNGGAYVLWQDYTTANGTSDVLFKKITLSSTPPPLQ